MAIILPVIRTRIQDVLEFPPERVLPDAREDTEEDVPTQADQFVLLRVGGGDFVPGIQGAGRLNLQVVREITCTLWTRLETDQIRSDEEWLANASLGHLQCEHKLWDALATYQPVDGDGNWLVAYPIVPRRFGPPRKGRKRKGWGRSTLAFDVSFTLDVDQDYI